MNQEGKKWCWIGKNTHTKPGDSLTRISFFWSPHSKRNRDIDVKQTEKMIRDKDEWRELKELAKNRSAWLWFGVAPLVDKRQK